MPPVLSGAGIVRQVAVETDAVRKESPRFDDVGLQVQLRRRLAAGIHLAVAERAEPGYVPGFRHGADLLPPAHMAFDRTVTVLAE